MAEQFPEIHNFQGLYLQANSYLVPDGALEQALNVVIQSDGVMTKSKGFYEYWRPAVGPLTALKVTRSFQGRLIGVFSNGAGYFTDTYPYGGSVNAVGTLSALSGDSFTADYRVRFSEDQTLYWTTLAEPRKLETATGKVRRLGVPPGITLAHDTFLRSLTVLGVLPPDSQTSYRAVFGRRDENGKLLLGAPSDILTLGVPAPATGLAFTIASNVVTVTWPGGADLRADSFYSYEVTVSAVGAPYTTMNGTRSLTYASGNNFTFPYTAANGSGTMTITVRYSPAILVDIPSEIDAAADGWFVRLYRSSSSVSYLAQPDPDFRLTQEVSLSTANIMGQAIRLEDQTSTQLLGDELYTNPNTREGELAENSRPPSCRDIVLYKSMMLYLNVETVQRMQMNVLSLLDASNRIIFKQGGVTESYRAIYGNAINLKRDSVEGSGTTSITIGGLGGSGAGHFAGEIVRLTDITGTLPAGNYAVTSVATSTITITGPSGATMTAGYGQVISDGTSYLFYGDGTGDVSPGEKVETFTVNLCRIINLVSSFMYANYLSTFGRLPGQMGIQSKVAGLPIYMRTQDAQTPQVFLQSVPTSFSSGLQFYSENEIAPSRVYVSKIGESEAVPVVSSLDAGAKNGEILRGFALADAVILVKTDGVFKISGDVPSQLTVTEIDTTLKFSKTGVNLAAQINNTVIAQSSKGMVQISSQGVGIVSRKVEDLYRPLSGRNLGYSYLAGHESENMLYAQTISINAGDPDTVWVYNVLNQTWTESDVTYRSLSEGVDDALIAVRYDQSLDAAVIYRQRKTQTLLDYCGRYAAITLTASTDQLSGYLVVTGGNSITPGPGDVILYNNIFTRISTVTPSGGGYMLTFPRVTNVPKTETKVAVLYKAYASKVRMAPFHAGKVGLEKHFSEFQISLRQAAITDLDLGFATSNFDSSEITDWDRYKVSSGGSGGWGFAPWGYFSWGQTEGVRLKLGTRASCIVRTWVPELAARGSWLAPYFTHNEAGQPLLIQSMTFGVSAYGERQVR